MIGKALTFYSIAKKEGVKQALRKSNNYILKRVLPSPIKSRWLKKSYSIPNDFQDYEHPPNPYKPLWVSPDNIQQFSGRDYPPYHGNNARLGVVMDGEWDKNKPKEIDPEYKPRYNLYREDANCFSESKFYQSLENHFLNDVPWEKTEWYQISTDYIKEGKSTSKGITSVEDLGKRCREIDRLFQKIRNEGYQSQKNLGNYPAAAKEVNIDIARDGTLLFVNGRNRLSIAKILDIDKIPVGVYVRHSEWMEHRDKIIPTTASHSHPDIDI